jgi:2-polyprenyl-3-methyl-5-hydroxy-6-metoxy-1,4-benzoquinol methylase
MIADRICHSKVSSILDIGCGPGQVAQLLRDKGVQKYLGIDFSSERIKHAKRICPEFDFVQTDVFKSDLLSNSHYDGVICLEFLEHVDRDVQVIEALRPGTRFWGSVPNFGAKQHVRYFHNCEEVIERYGNYFDDFKVDEHLANTLGAKFFVIEGIVK